MKRLREESMEEGGVCVRFGEEDEDEVERKMQEERER